jgi:hypothetical protein
MLTTTEGSQKQPKVLLQRLFAFTDRRRGFALLAVPLGALLVLLAAACGGGASSEPATSAEEPAAAAQATTVHSSPTCGCCGQYEQYLKEEGFEVESQKEDDNTEIKSSLGIPEEMWSCHTSIVGGYFVEGHVPVEAIRKLLDERPQIDGIALPGMPPGSPGMGGDKTEPFTIYSISNGAIEEFTTL